MNKVQKKFTVQMWRDSNLQIEFQSTEDSWLETSHVKIHEGGMYYSYDHSRSKGKVVAFTHHSEGIVKEFFNLDSMMVSES